MGRSGGRTGRVCAEVGVIVLALAGVCAPPAVAKRPQAAPAARCAARKLAATGASALVDFHCHGQAAAKGKAVGPGCLAAARRRLSSAFRKAERGAGAPRR
jgi:hypothetical protein